MDFVFDRVAGGRPLTRLLDQLAWHRGLPRIIRTDNGKEFTGNALLTWAHERGVALRLIKPGKPMIAVIGYGFQGQGHALGHRRAKPRSDFISASDRILEMRRRAV